MLVINSIYDLLSLVTTVAGICIAIQSLLHWLTRHQTLAHHVEYIDIILLSLAIALWSFLPLLEQQIAVEPAWMWLSVAMLAFALTLFTFSLCRDALPGITQRQWLMFLLGGTLLIPLGGLGMTHWNHPGWTLTAVVLVNLIFAVNTAMVIGLAHKVRDRLYKVISLFLMVFTICFMVDSAILVGFRGLYPTQVLNLIGVFFLMISVGFSAMDRAYLHALLAMNSQVEKAYEELAAEKENIEDVVISLARTIDAKDKYTEGHIERVSQYAVFLGERMGFGSPRLEHLRIGALIHDLGKIGVDQSVLNKPGKLTPEEWEQIHSHPALGQQICSPLKVLQDAGDIIRHHHEKLDGSGYPDGLCGDQISLEARLVAVVDIFDALTTERSYRPALPVEEAINILKEEAAQGKLDSRLVIEFESMLYDMAVLLQET